MKYVRARFNDLSIRYAPWFALAAFVMGISFASVTVTSYVYEVKIQKVENKHRNIHNRQRREIVGGISDLSEKLDKLQGQILTMPEIIRLAIKQANNNE